MNTELIKGSSFDQLVAQQNTKRSQNYGKSECYIFWYWFSNCSIICFNVDLLLCSLGTLSRTILANS